MNIKKRAFLHLVSLALAVLALTAAIPCAAAEGGPAPDLALTEEEQAYVDACGTLRVGYVQDRVPVSFTGQDGSFAGISRYILDRVAGISGLDFEYVPLPAGAVTYDYLLEQDLALVTSVEYNEANKKANGILISEPYLSSRKVVVARADLSFDRNASFRAALSSGSQTIRTVLGGIFPNFELVDYDSIGDCFDAVCSGEADLTIQNQFVVEYWMARPKYDEMQVIPLMGLNDQLCFSAVVAMDERGGPDPAQGHLLIDILDKAIASVSEDEVSGYIIQAVMENQYSFTVGDFLYRYRFAVVSLGLSALVIVVLALLLLRQRMLSVEDRANAKAKGEFLSTMSHEIRTPLNGLIGLNYLMGQRLDDQQRLAEYLRQSSATAKYLLCLVDDILDMSKLEDNEIELASEPMDLALVLDTVCSIVRGGMVQKGLTFTTEISLTCPWVVGDEARVQQVILNLLDNARKFTPSGGRVTLRAAQDMQPSGVMFTRIEVSDTGRGMSEEFQKKVFHSFAQELETVSKGNQGTGLGLPICLHLSRLMGGDLSFTSQKDVGSDFVFTFAGEPTQPPAEEPGQEVPPARSKVLVAEDNDLNGEIMLELLGDQGFQAELAKDGRQALQIFSDSPAGTFGVVLMDLLMPEMDGFTAAAAIRALDRPDAKTVRIIACTANSSDEDRSRARASGMDGFITKPVDVGQLMQVLS